MNPNVLKNWFLDDPCLDFLKFNYKRCSNQLSSKPSYLPDWKNYLNLLFIKSEQHKSSVLESLSKFEIIYFDNFNLITTLSQFPNRIILKPSYSSAIFNCSPDLILGSNASLFLTGQSNLTILNIKNADLYSNSKYNQWLNIEMFINWSTLSTLSDLHFSYGLLNKHSTWVPIDNLNIDIQPAIDWINLVKKSDWNLTTLPDTRILPNMNNKMDSPWTDIKKELAMKWFETSYLLGLGYLRPILHLNNIFSYKDPKLLPYLDQTRDTPLVKKIVKNFCNPIYTPQIPLYPYTNEEFILSVDTESLIMPVKNAYSGDVMIGVLSITSSAESMIWFIDIDEKKCIEQYHNWYNNLPQKPIKIIHYTSADLRVMSQEMLNICEDIYPAVKNWYESNLMRNFSLKTVSNVLFGDMYKDCDIKGGLEATTALWWYFNNTTTNNLTRYLEEVKKYNEIDCRALFQVYKHININI
jgi:hypothetical protein